MSDKIKEGTQEYFNKHGEYYKGQDENIENQERQNRDRIQQEEQ